jgi:hypothetical protein
MFSKSEGVIPRCPHSFWWFAYRIMPTIVGSIIVDYRWHDLMTNKIIHNCLKGVLESPLGDKKKRHVQRAKKVFWGKFAQKKYYTRFVFNNFFTNSYVFIYHIRIILDLL